MHIDFVMCKKGSIEKTPVFKKKTKFGYCVLGLRKPNFKTKIIRFEKSHNAENCKRGALRDFLTSILLQNFKKLKRDLKNFAKKNKK